MLYSNYVLVTHILSPFPNASLRVICWPKPSKSSRLQILFKLCYKSTNISRNTRRIYSIKSQAMHTNALEMQFNFLWSGLVLEVLGRSFCQSECRIFTLLGYFGYWLLGLIYQTSLEHLQKSQVAAVFSFFSSLTQVSVICHPANLQVSRAAF